MKRLKALVVLVSIIIGFSNVAKGQVYSDGFLYFHGENINRVLVVKFDGNRAIIKICSGFTFGDEEPVLRRHLKEDPMYYETCPRLEVLEYDSEKSTYEFSVYKITSAYWTGNYNAPTKNRTKYLKISRDMRNLSYDKWNYIQVDKEYYLPKDDFYDD